MHSAIIEHGYIKVPTGIVGELVRSEKAVLYLHGNNTSIERQEVPANLLHEATGLTIVLPEYSGHGNNESATYDQTMLAMHELEAIVAYDWLAERIGEENIIIYGTSYGGALAAVIMKHRKPGKVVLFAPALGLDEDSYITRGTKPHLSPEANKQTPQAALQNVLRATNGEPVKLAVLKAEHDDMVAGHIVDAWKEAYPGAEFITPRETQHSVRQSSEQGRREWLDAMQKAVA